MRILSGPRPEALALGAERPEPGVMTRPPRPRQARLLDARVLGVGLAALTAFVYAPPVYHLFGQHPLRAAQWLPIVIAPWVLLAAEELLKLFVRRRLAANRHQRLGGPRATAAAAAAGSCSAAVMIRATGLPPSRLAVAARGESRGRRCTCRRS
jgi:hypothetical protein